MSHTVIPPDCTVTVGGNRNPARPRGVGETNPANTEDILKMPKLKTLAALAAAVEAGRRYARKNPDQAGKYVDQAAAFVDKQTKGKYSGQIHGVVGKVKSVGGPAAHHHPGLRHERRLRQARGLRCLDRGAGPAEPPDRAVDHPVDRLHPAHAVHGRPGAHRRAALPGEQGPLIAGAAPPPPTLTAVVPR